MKSYISDDDLGILAVCALRYCMARRTESPDAVIGIVREYISELIDSDILILYNDCLRQRETGRYSESAIDKPSWLAWAEVVRKEKERRKL